MHLEQALPLGQGVSLHGPEVDVRLSTGHDQVGVHGVKHGRQHRLVGALQGGRRSARFNHQQQVLTLLISDGSP